MGLGLVSDLSFLRLQSLIDSLLTDVRLDAGLLTLERVCGCEMHHDWIRACRAVRAELRGL